MILNPCMACQLHVILQKCTISNQRPRITFDSDGVCSACRFQEFKRNGIDWDKRRQELHMLCDQHRKDDGSYDVVVHVAVVRMEASLIN